MRKKREVFSFDEVECNKGSRCGGSCIAATDNCKQTAKGDLKAMLSTWVDLVSTRIDYPAPPKYKPPIRVPVNAPVKRKTATLLSYSKAQQASFFKTILKLLGIKYGKGKFNIISGEFSPHSKNSYMQGWAKGSSKS